MYMGEIVRRILLQMAQEAALFGANIPPKLEIPYILKYVDLIFVELSANSGYVLEL